MKFVRLACAVVLGLAALFHLEQAVTAHGSVPRHLVFVLVNGALAALLVLRPRWALWPVIAVMVQQLGSHGLDLAQSFNGNVPFDWTALAVCIFYPTLASALYIERQE